MSLSYFEGKLCTVLTSPANRHFVDESQYANTFVGVVEKVDDLGLWMVQMSTKRKSFFMLHNIVGIIEESVKFFDTDEQAESFRKQLEAKIPAKDTQGLISVESLKKIKKNNQEKSR